MTSDLRATTHCQPRLLDFEPATASIRDVVLRGLQRQPKELPALLFYDERGARLFDQICDLEEYYPTRTELAIMHAHVGEMAELIGRGCLLVEYGSGSSLKTRLLLDHLKDPAGYVPIDISREQLLAASAELARSYPHLEVLPVCADFTGDFHLPMSTRPAARVVAYYPGSTIGNLHPEQARRMLQSIARVCGRGSGLLIGVDLRKDPQVLHRAYNDSRGVTAAFNLNLLARLNRELDANFALDQFQHYAFYNPLYGRIEMHLVSLRAQVVRIGDIEVPFQEGESIWTESSYKYRFDDFERLGTSAGYRLHRVWTDAQRLFSVQYLSA